MKLLIAVSIFVAPFAAYSDDKVDKAKHREDAIVTKGQKGAVVVTPGRDHADAPPPGPQKTLVFPNPPKKLERDKTTIVTPEKK